MLSNRLCGMKDTKLMGLKWPSTVSLTFGRRNRLRHRSQFQFGANAKPTDGALLRKTPKYHRTQYPLWLYSNTTTCYRDALQSGVRNDSNTRSESARHVTIRRTAKSSVRHWALASRLSPPSFRFGYIKRRGYADSFASRLRARCGAEIHEGFGSN